MIKQNKKFLSTSFWLILMILLISQVCYADEINSTTVDTIILKSEKCNLVVQESQNNHFKYDYDRNLFELTTKTKQNNLTIQVKPKYNAEVKWYDKVIISIPNSLNYEKVNVENNNSNISLCEINTELNIVSNEGATSFFIPKDLNHNVSYTGDKSAGTATLFSETNNYKLSLLKEDSAVSIPFSDYNINDLSYTYIKGDGSSQINIHTKNSAFTVKEDTYEKLKTKLTFKYMSELGIHTPSIDKSTLPTNMKNCKFYTMLNIDKNTPINAIIQEYLLEDETKYDYEYIPLESEAYFGIYEKSLILLFDKDKKLLGYATIPMINEGDTYVNFYKYIQLNSY